MMELSAAKELPVADEVDVLVVGGGPAGVAAGFAAARLGMRTLIVEQFNCLGGIATAGGHGHMCLYSSFGNPQWGTDELVVGGIPCEIAQRVTDEGFGEFNGANADFEVEGLKKVLEDMASACNVRLLYHTLFADAVVSGGTIVGVVIQNKTGRQFVRAQRVVDCSGDGDVAARAGCHFEVGNAEGKCQPVTLMFQIGGVDYDRVSKFRSEQPDDDWNLCNVWRTAQDKGDMRPFQTVIMGWWWTPTRPDQLGVNFTHVTGIDATRADDLTRATLEARKQVFETVRVYQRYVPGMENCYLISTAATIGTRESRRIVGEYVLTKDDLVAEKEFGDAIGYGSFFIDIHNCSGPGMDARAMRPRNGFKYQIPYRILLPIGVENLVVAGRCASCTHEALGSLRVMPQCGVMGQAAGTACALSVRHRTTPRSLAVAELRSSLRQQGCIVDATGIRKWTRKNY